MQLSEQLRLAILTERSFRIPVYSSLVYLSRSKHRGVDPDCDDVQDLVQDTKDGNQQAIKNSAAMLAKHPGLKGFQGWVAPVPRSATNRPSNMTLARTLTGLGVGTKAIDMVTRIKAIESSRMKRRKSGVQAGTSMEQHLASMGFVGEIADAGILLVDDIFTTGATVKAAALTMRKAGYKGPIFAATLGYYEPNPKKSNECPVRHKTFYV
jgi:phosphoribosylpyrophosphate synthetase